MATAGQADEPTPGYPSPLNVMREKLEELLCCKICEEEFDMELRCPKLLPCHHSFCLMCLFSLFDKATNREEDGRKCLPCPNCPQETWLDEQEMSNLKNDFNILTMMDVKFVPDDKVLPNFCQKHHQQPLNFFCKTCKVMVCIHCTVVSHKESKGHDVIETSDAIDQFLPQCLATLDRTTELSTTLQERLNSNHDYLTRLTQNKRDEMDHIEETFAAYHTIVDTRKADVMLQLDEKVQNRKNEVEHHNKETKKSMSTLTKLHQAFQKAKDSNDIEKLVALSQEMDRWMKLSQDTGILTNKSFYNFTAEGGEPFKEQLRTLGDIEEQP